MKEKLLKNRTLVIIVAAIVLAAIGFSAGMLAKTSLAGNGGDYMGLEEAKTAALENVGVSKANATFTKAQLDETDSPAVYDIEFHTASNEYDFEINAKNGEIIEKSSEAITSTQPADTAQSASQPQQSTQAANPENSTASSSDYIGVNKAKSIALKHAGISSSKASFTKAKLDSDDGVKTYEIEFTSGGREYEYEINAYTGHVRGHDSEHIQQHHNSTSDDDDDHDDDHDDGDDD